jgi:hypothetical protein
MSTTLQERQFQAVTSLLPIRIARGNKLMRQGQRRSNTSGQPLRIRVLRRRSDIARLISAM